jgi:sugar phosphate isomerase/epimerase
MHRYGRACDFLACACREHDAEQKIHVRALRLDGDPYVFHTYATWGAFASDASGWNLEDDLMSANTELEGRAVERCDVMVGLTEFCDANWHRLPDQYWRDPRPRAARYVSLHAPPW